ncbi:radical SAM protein [Desulfosporosinus sp. PR]|uniref:radical SAM protein n=1 Tax=Candidatus Desulfosporosinus nitrosoreducens TaxID=3401928 RepID=UPI0027FD14D1|nr:radical SAM protein [Desulfosporosinus sp. PR]MDQ7093735.1 radical SAM protein [Desulfosporosinus sp. PR]
MIIDINERSLNQIKNPDFSKYAAIYTKIYEGFLQNVSATGIDIDSRDIQEEIESTIERLKSKGVVVRNNQKSLFLNRISPACEACKTAESSVTMFISLMCNRKCYFCFNPNQEDYRQFARNRRNVVKELNDLSQSGQRVDYLALTGGEPTLHKKEMIQFFAEGRERFPQAHTRLYTTGDFLDQKSLIELAQTRLNEIRFSIKLEDAVEKRQRVLERIALAQNYIPAVMVEMPVLPGSLDIMKELLRDLDQLGVYGINLLEFCYPYLNANIYREKEFKIKSRPFRVLYDYWYAGALPVAQSEIESLALLEFAADEGLKLGVHYCSLENKNTGQIFRQNSRQKLDKTLYFSPRDFFLKSAKVYGGDIPKVEKVFKKAGYHDYTVNREHNYLEFHVKQVDLLVDLDVEIGISSSVLEKRADGEYLRELKVDLTYPKIFDLAQDLGL